MINKPMGVSVVFPSLHKTVYIEKNIKLLECDPVVCEILQEIGTSPIGKARQNLLNRAKGQYILWIDDDVELLSNPLPKLLSHLKGNVKAVCASTLELDATYYMNETHRRLLPKVYRKMKSSFNCGLYDTAALREIGGFSVTLSAAEDNEVNMKLRKKGFEVLGLRDTIVRHHSTRDYEKEFNYFQGIKYLYNTYGSFESECKQIRAGKIKTNLVKFQVSPAKFLADKGTSLQKHLYNKLHLISQLYDNTLYGINPEWRKPREVGLLITENCFFKCKSCTFWQEKKPEATFGQLREMIDKLADFGIYTLTLVGGEPTSRKDLTDIIKHVKKRGMRCTIITNGALGKQKIKDLLLLDTISISLDGMERNHDDLRGIVSWSKNLDLLYELKHKYHKDVNVGFVVQSANQFDLKPLSNLLSDMGIPLHLMCFNAGGMGQPEGRSNYTDSLKHILSHRNEHVLRREQLLYLALALDTFSKGKQKRQRCDGPNTKFMVDSKGNVFPCSAWSTPIGNLLKARSFKQIWDSYRTLRKQFIKGTHPYCKTCTSCELTNNFIRGFQYHKRVKEGFISKFSSS